MAISEFVQEFAEVEACSAATKSAPEDSAESCGPMALCRALCILGLLELLCEHAPTARTNSQALAAKVPLGML